MHTDHKALVRRFYDEVVNRGNLALADELMAPDYAEHGSPEGETAGRAGFERFVGMVTGAFPDLQVSVEDLIAEGDKVVARLTVRGTHRGELMGIPPTGRPATWSGIDIFEVSGGRITGRWNVRDLLGLVTQLGVVLTPPDASDIAGC
jgi:steroid delta-isomerase-like uncharacterized protein